MADLGRLKVEISADPSPAKRDLADFENTAKRVGSNAAAAMTKAMAQAAKVEAEVAKVSRAFLVQTEISTQRAVQSAQMAEKAIAGAMQGASKHYGALGQAAHAANQNIKLTGSQMQGLGYQINDIGTMLAMGSSPFQIMASQAGQVIQVLGDGPGGMKGSLKAIGVGALGLLTPVNMLVAGLAAAGAAGIYFATRTKDQVKPLTDALEDHRNAVAGIAAAYGSAAKGADVFATGAAAAFRQRYSSAALRRSINANVVESLTDQGLFGRRGMPSEFAPFKDIVGGLKDEIRVNALDTAAAIQEISKRAELDPLNDDLQRTADTLVKILESAAQAQAEMKGLAEAKEKLARAQLKDAFGTLGSHVPDQRSDRAKIEADYQDAVRRSKTEADLTHAQDLRRLSLDALSQAEANRRAGYDLDIKELTARTAAEKAALAAERARLEAASDPNLRDDPNKVNQLAQEASDRSMAESRTRYNEAIRQQTQATKDQVAAAQEEIQLFGKSAGETARLRAEFEMLAQAKEAARNAGFNADTVTLTDEMKRQAAVLGETTAALEKMNFERDIAFRIAQAGRSDQDRRIGQELYSAGIDFNSDEGQRRAGMIRTAEATEKAADAMRDLHKATQDTFGDMLDGIAQGENAFDSFISSFAQLGRKMASAGFDRLFGWFFGGGEQQSASAFATTIGTIGASLGASSVGGSSSGGIGSDYARSSSMPPILTASAAQITRAGNAFLDLIGRAEGTDKGRGYNETLGYGRFTGGNQNLVGMSLNQIDALQTSMLRHTENTFNSSALGRYQIVRSTLRGLRTELGLSGDELFSPKLQDELALQLANRRGASVAGLRNEWEGLRNVSGGDILSAYGGANDNAIARGVSSGMIDYSRKAVSGAVPSLGLPSFPGAAGVSGGASPSWGAQQLLNNGWDGFGGQGKAAFAACGQMLAGGLGAFASGYQSGSPISGALGGALAGAPGGPPGMIIGAIAGAVGGAKGQRRTSVETWSANDAAWNDYSEKEAA